MKLTWLGHSCFRLVFDQKVILIDPFITGNPSFRGDPSAATDGVTHIIVTHGHADHLGDTRGIALSTGATVITSFEICEYLQGNDVKKLQPAGLGGEITVDGFTVAFVPAMHSSSITMQNGEPLYLGVAAGVVIHADNHPRLYHAGDTCAFSDMALINDMYNPHVGILPIGGRFTMDIRAAALAAKRFFNFKRIIPCHYNTFPIIEANPQDLVEALKDVEVDVEILPVGGSTRLTRYRLHKEN